jgi:tetratricopeptide (TPR) repeat protein/DNA-binding XRE family transcriptional regulator
MCGTAWSRASDGARVSQEEAAQGSALGELLRQCRRASGLSQEELGELSGLGVRTICDIERGQTLRPYRATVGALAGALGLQGPQHDEFVRASRRGGAPGLPGGRLALVPRQLPAPVRHFVGRASELKALDDVLDQVGKDATAVVSIIGGTAGVGKTTLAVHWAHQVAQHFPDGQVYPDLRGFDPSGKKVTRIEAVRVLLDALHVPAEQIPASLDAQVGLYRSTLAGQRVLLVLDNALDAHQIRPLLPGSPGCLTVVTSRSQLMSLVTAHEALPLTLCMLTSREARELLAGRLGADRVSSQPAAVNELISLCGRLPLALAIVAARAALGPAELLTRLASELRDSQGQLSALDAGDANVSARAAFSWSYQELSEPVARMFRLLGLHPGPDISIPAAASLAGVSLLRAQELLEDLTRANLVSAGAIGRPSLHDLLRSYAGELAHEADSELERRQALHRALDYYLHSACTAALIMHPSALMVAPAPPQPGVTEESFGDYQQAIAWFEAERQVLSAVIALAARTGFAEHAARLPAAMRDFLEYRGYWADIVITQQAALDAASRLGDKPGEARAHRGLGHVCTLLGDLDVAYQHCKAAVDLGRQLADRSGEGRANLGISRIREQQARYSQALEHSRQALDLFRSVGDLAGEAAALNNVGTFQVETGDALAAVEASQQSIGLHQQLGHRQGVAGATDTLGQAYYRLGDLAAAVGCFQKAAALCSELGDRLDTAMVLTHLGDAHRAAADHPGAQAAWRSALEILDQLQHRDAEQVRARLRDLG